MQGRRLPFFLIATGLQDASVQCLQVALHAERLPAMWQAGERAICEGGPLAFAERFQNGRLGWASTPPFFLDSTATCRDFASLLTWKCVLARLANGEPLGMSAPPDLDGPLLCVGRPGFSLCMGLQSNCQ